MRKAFIILFAAIILTSCSENYSNGERIGLITQFSKTGVFWKSWEGHLNMTQTGMNSSTPFDFSIDNDNEPEGLVKILDSAARFGWKVKIVYHETIGKNWFSNRGQTDHFVINCEVLDRTPIQSALGNNSNTRSGKIIDTIYVVIDNRR